MWASVLLKDGKKILLGIVILDYWWGWSSHSIVLASGPGMGKPWIEPWTPQTKTAQNSWGMRAVCSYGSGVWGSTQLSHRIRLPLCLNCFQSKQLSCRNSKKAPLNSWNVGAGHPHSSAVSNLLVAFAGMLWWLSWGKECRGLNPCF